MSDMAIDNSTQIKQYLGDWGSVSSQLIPWYTCNEIILKFDIPLYSKQIVIKVIRFFSPKTPIVVHYYV
jgi:hypothetical protein